MKLRPCKEAFFKCAQFRHIGMKGFTVNNHNKEHITIFTSVQLFCHFVKDKLLNAQVPVMHYP